MISKPNVLFVHGRTGVSLHSTNSVNRLIAQTAKAFTAFCDEVHIACFEESNALQGITFIKLRQVGAITQLKKRLLTRLGKKSANDSNIKTSYAKQVLANYRPDKWVVIACRTNDADVARKNSDCKLILWVHHFQLPSAFDSFIYQNKRPAALVFPSQAIADAFHQHLIDKGFWPSTISLPNLNDTELVAEADKLRNRDINHDDVLRLLFLGGNNPRKGIHNVEFALHNLQLQPDQQVELYALGFEQQRDVSISQACKIHYLPLQNRDELKQYLQMCDVGLVPSVSFDNAPTALREMTTFGMFVLASKVGGISEMMPMDSLLVDPCYSPLAWQNALQQCVDHLSEIRQRRLDRYTQAEKINPNTKVLSGWNNLLCTLLSSSK
ncbi:MAG TPA: glycosyltransferase [Phnomibacter sp.]|nr:glycosyltransferase [Phnomibacter sp.]